MTNILPYIVMTCGSALYVSESVALKSYEHVPLIHQLFIICLSTMIPASCVVMYYNSIHQNQNKNNTSSQYNFTSLFTNTNNLIVGVLMTLFFLTAYNGYKSLPVSLSVPIFMLAPITILLFSNIINKTSVNSGQILSAIVSFAGVVCVCYSKQNTSNTNFTFGIVSMLIGVISYALSYTLQKYSPERTFLKLASRDEYKMDDTKSMVEKVHINLLNIFTIPFICISVIMCVMMFMSPKQLQWLPKPYQGTTIYPTELLILFGIFFIINYGHNVAFFYAFDNIPLANYGVLENNNVIFSLLIGYFILKENMSMQKIIGCFIIIAGVIGSIYFKDSTTQKSKIIKT